MSRSTDKWAQKLIASGLLTPETYVEVTHLDSEISVFVYVRALALRYVTERAFARVRTLSFRLPMILLRAYRRVLIMSMR